MLGTFDVEFSTRRPLVGLALLLHSAKARDTRCGILCCIGGDAILTTGTRDENSTPKVQEALTNCSALLQGPSCS